MTTPDPLDGIMLPYSVNFSPNPGAWVTLPAGPNTLPMGVVMVRLTWAGTEGIRYQLQRDLGTKWVSTAWDTVIAPAAEETPRSSPPIELAIGVPTRIYIQGDRTFGAAHAGSGLKIGMTVIPTAPPA